MIFLSVAHKRKIKTICQFDNLLEKCTFIITIKPHLTSVYVNRGTKRVIREGHQGIWPLGYRPGDEINIRRGTAQKGNDAINHVDNT